MPNRSPGRRAQRDEESVYRIDPQALPAMAVKTLNVVPTSPGAAAPAVISPNAKSPHGRLKEKADSSQIQNIFNPVMGPRDAMLRAGIKPPDHVKAHANAIREQSQLNALRKISDAAQAQQEAEAAKNRAAQTKHQVERHLQQQQGVLQWQLQPDNGRNFVKENKMGAAQNKPKLADQDKDDGMKYLHKKDYGQVPNYLHNRKAQLSEEQEQREREREAALLPAGMRMMPEEERLETLALLQQNKVEVERALQALPLRIETPGQIRRQNELVTRLKEIEDATRVFSRPKVLVHM